MPEVAPSPAEQAAEETRRHVYACIDKGRSFRLEAGAGAGKTYSLIEALRYLIKHNGTGLLRQHQQVACISYTNVASNEIASRIEHRSAIHSSTIHAFCWSLIKDFQPIMRNELPNIDIWWSEKLEESGGIGTRRIGYNEFGRRTVEETQVSLNHNDVLVLTTKLMERGKFRTLLASRYPVLLIDEYQDTDILITQALKAHFLDTGEGPLIGFFGDHWQKIYGSSCGKIEHPALEFIGKGSNFRSVPVIVEALNRMRPDLPQHVKEPSAEGFVAVYHTNDWVGVRRTGQHWDGDLPDHIAHEYLEAVKNRLASTGWDFASDKTKILMLTHKVLAMEQGYGKLADVFPFNEAYIKKEDTHIAFFVDTLEPVCSAYEAKRFGEMFAALGRRTPPIQSHKDKLSWAEELDALLKLRAGGTIGGVLDYLKHAKHIRLPDAVERKERELEQVGKNPTAEESPSIERLRKLRNVSYKEVVALDRFIDGFTPFSTKHGVKGAEFENVLVVVGRGWNQYNFNQFLEWAGAPDAIPPGKEEAFERNRNLFYVACSRPKKRLAILFTQKLSDKAMATLAKWFGSEDIHSLRIIN